MRGARRSARPAPRRATPLPAPPALPAGLPLPWAPWARGEKTSEFAVPLYAPGAPATEGTGSVSESVRWPAGRAGAAVGRGGGTAGPSGAGPREERGAGEAVRGRIWFQPVGWMAVCAGSVRGEPGLSGGRAGGAARARYRGTARRERHLLRGRLFAMSSHRRVEMQRGRSPLPSAPLSSVCHVGPLLREHLF